MVVSMLQHIVSKLADIEVISDKVVNLGYLTLLYLLADVVVALQSLHRFTPYLCWQIPRFWGALVPTAATLQEVRLRGVDTLSDVIRDGSFVPMLYGIIDITVAALLQVLPNAAVSLKGIGCGLLRGIE